MNSCVASHNMESNFLPHGLENCKWYDVKATISMMAQTPTFNRALSHSEGTHLMSWKAIGYLDF